MPSFSALRSPKKGLLVPEDGVTETLGTTCQTTQCNFPEHLNLSAVFHCGQTTPCSVTDKGNRGNENYCSQQHYINHIMFLWVKHAWIFVHKSDKFTSSIMWHLFHTLKVTALTEKFGRATAVLSPHMAYFHSLLLFCIAMHQHRTWITPPLKSYSTKLYTTDGQGIHTVRSNLADIQEISKDQYFGGLNEHTFFLYTWRLSKDQALKCHKLLYTEITEHWQCPKTVCLLTETHVLKKVCFMWHMWQECVSRNTCAKDSVFCETLVPKRICFTRDIQVWESVSWQTHTPKRIWFMTSAMRQVHTCQRQCFVRETCARAIVSW